MLHAELKVIGGSQNDQVVPLQQGKFLIGREQDCQLRPNSELVSRHHCVFTVDEFGVRVRDLGSTNGTFVNGERIEKPVEIKAGDRVQIGTLNFEVIVREAAPVAAGGDAGAVEPEAPAAPEVPVADPALENTETGSETVFDMPALQDDPSTTDSQAITGADTTMLPNAAYPPQQVPQAPPYAPPPIQYPPGYGQYQPQPMYPPPQYPGMGYPQPPMPGYPQPMPQQPMPPQPMPPQQQPPAPEPEAAASDIPEVTLPNPSDTGLKPEQDSKGSAGSSKDGDNPSGTAGDIIKQYIQRRPT